LGTKFTFKRAIFYITETDDTRRNQVSSLKTCRLQSQLVIDELGASYTTFSKCSNSPYGSGVSLLTQFHKILLKDYAPIRSKDPYTKV